MRMRWPGTSTCAATSRRPRGTAPCSAWARATPPFEWVDLEVLSQNHQARALYARMGFKVTGEVPDLYRIGGLPVGAVSMSFALG